MEGEEQSSALPVACTLAVRLGKVLEEVAAIPDYRNSYRKHFANMARRMKLLAPVAEELCERRDPLPQPATRCLERLVDAVGSAKELLRFGSEASRIFMVFQRDQVVQRFQKVISLLEESLGGILSDDLSVSDEVKEQVELVWTQMKRAKEKTDMLDAELYAELQMAYHKPYESEIDPEILLSLSEKLCLTTIADLTQESLALHDMVLNAGDPGEHIEKMSMLLKKIKDFVQTQNPAIGKLTNFKYSPHSDANLYSLVVPDAFQCPISLELMEDPVIIVTGQTYERECIEKWIASGHNTCPVTQQKIANNSLTPNFVLRSLIAQWCEANNLEPPKRSYGAGKSIFSFSASDQTNIESLILKLQSSDVADQCSAAGELRLLSKRSIDHRIYIAMAGAVPVLVRLLTAPDLRTQGHAITTLLNLSIHDNNKSIIVSSGALVGIVHVLRSGSMEARENAAATLYSLALVDEYKVTIGATGAIPGLLLLLKEGSLHGKKDAITALFNLCMYQGNKGEAVRAGLVPLLMEFINNPVGLLKDESMVILSILSRHPEGRVAIGTAGSIPVLVEMIRSGSPRNQENAVAILLNLCRGEKQLEHLNQSQQCGLMGPLRGLAVNGTVRAKRKAVQLLELMTQFLLRQQEQELEQLPE